MRGTLRLRFWTYLPSGLHPRVLRPNPRVLSTLPPPLFYSMMEIRGTTRTRGTGRVGPRRPRTVSPLATSDGETPEGGGDSPSGARAGEVNVCPTTATGTLVVPPGLGSRRTTGPGGRGPWFVGLGTEERGGLRR